MDPRLLAYAEQPAPRYTSYPTAPHFTPGVSGDVFADWLGALNTDGTLSLYIHVPYCRSICRYCGCHAFATRKDEPVADYVETLIAEIEAVARATKARRVVEIAWGGGTPNILSPTQFARLTEQLNAWFDLSTLRTHGVEVDPRLLTPAHARAFAAAGVTRASLGVQDVNAHVQQAMGRVQPLKIVARAAEALREAGLAQINLDLMYGLPLQTLNDVVASARAAAGLNPDRIAAFGYAHAPWFKSRQRLINEDDLPGAAARLAQAAALRAALEAEGYAAIGFDHYARPGDALAAAARAGTLRRNFQGFVADQADALIGLGPSAISTLPQGYAQNAARPAAWAAAIQAGALSTARGIAVSDEDRVRRAVIERLLCDGSVDLGAYGGLETFEGAYEALAPLVRDGLVEIDGDVIAASALGRPFVRLAAQAFDAYRKAAPARHARAV